MKQIYIVLIKAHTGLGKFARRLTGYEYTHIAVCTDRTLTDFMTYSRRRHYVPLDAGFMHEYRDYYAFGEHRRVKVKVFRLPVEEKRYRRVMSFIAACEQDDEQMFNLFSMMTMPLVHGFRIYKAHNCMSFTAKVLGLSGAVKLQKPYYRYSIREMDQLLHAHACFEGYLKRLPSAGYKAYMEKPPLSEQLRISAHTVSVLAERMLLGHSIED